MTQPVYKLADNMVVCAKHMRDERARNDLVYATKNAVDEIQSDIIFSTSNPQSYLLANSASLLMGSTPLNANQNKIQNLAEATINGDAVRYEQLISGLSAKTDITTTTALTTQVNTNTSNISTIQTQLPLKQDKSDMINYLSRSGGDMLGDINMNGNNILLTTDATTANQVPRKSQIDAALALKADVTDVPTDADFNQLTARVTAAELSSALNATNINTLSDQQTLLSANLQTNYHTKIQDNALFKPIGQIESKIQNNTQKTKISCDSDRYISITSNGTKIADILEDEVNAGFTLSSTKRINIVSTLPQTMYHNAAQGLFNIKYTGNSDTTTPLAANYGQIQLAPSNVTNLNPALTLISSRVNGLGTVGSLFLDSAYGQVETPLIIAPQSLTDASATQMIQYRAAATPVLKTQFAGKTGYSNGVQITEANQFTSKTYVDGQVTGKLNLTGGMLTGPLILSQDPTLALGAATKQYVDNSTQAGNFVKTDGTVAMGNDLSLGNFKIVNLANGINNNDAVTKQQVNSAILDATSGLLQSTDAAATYLAKQGGTMTGDIVLRGNASLNLHPVTLQQLNAAVDNISGSELIKGDYKTTLRDTGKLDIYDNSSGRGVTIDVASDATVTKIYSSTGSGRGLMLQSTSNPDNAASISLYDAAVNNMPIQFSSKAGYFLGSIQSITEPGQFTNKYYVDQAIAGVGVGNYYTKAEAHAYFAFKSAIPGQVSQTPLNQLGVPIQNINMNNYRIDNLGDGIVPGNAVNLAQLRESRPWSCRLSLGDPSGGTPSVISSTNNFVSSITKVGPSSGTEQGYQINFNSSNTPSFINSASYLAVCQLMNPDTQGSSVTWVNDCSPLVTYNQSGTSIAVYWEQTANVSQVVHIGVVFNPI